MCARFNFWSDLAHRPQHHREYRDEWAKLDLDDNAWRLLAQRSMEQAALVESALCGVLDTLDRLDLTEHTLIVACADHGDAVASNGGVANKGGLMVEECVRIPLLFSGPSITAGRRDSKIVANIDVAPTLLDLAGLKVPPDIQGASLKSSLLGTSGSRAAGNIAAALRAACAIAAAGLGD